MARPARYHRGRLSRRIEPHALLHPTNDSNRARWPAHELWRQFVDVIGNDLSAHCCGVQPDQVIYANRNAKMRELDRQLLGLFVSRAAISDVQQDEFYAFMERHIDALQRRAPEGIGRTFAESERSVSLDLEYLGAGLRRAVRQGFRRKKD